MAVNRPSCFPIGPKIECAQTRQEGKHTCTYQIWKRSIQFFLRNSRNNTALLKSKWPSIGHLVFRSVQRLNVHKLDRKGNLNFKQIPSVFFLEIVVTTLHYQIQTGRQSAILLKIQNSRLSAILIFDRSNNGMCRN